MLGIIGGSGFYKLDSLENREYIDLTTQLGKPSSEILLGNLNKTKVAFLARHGLKHSLSPSEINYRANILAFKNLGVKSIIGVHAVGAIDKIANESLVLPQNLIDYTYGRENSFFDGKFKKLEHIDFSYPFSQNLRNKILATAKNHSVDILDQGVYGVTQGIRLETAAEIERMKRDGCSIVGMTLMPEAVLAREAGLEYASISVVVNPAAGTAENAISIEEINENLAHSIYEVEKLLSYIDEN